MDTRTALAISLVVGIATPAAAGQPTFRIDDFEDQDLEAAPGLSWTAIGDWLSGGASSGEITVVRLPAGDRSRGALRFDGHLGQEAPKSYAGVWTGLRGDGLPRDLTGYRGLRFRVRGTPGSYQAGVRRQDGKSQANLLAPFDVTAAWTDVEIPFGDLEQVPPATPGMAFAPSGVAWLGFTSGATTPRDFRLEIDDIEVLPETRDEPMMRKVKLTDPKELARLSFATVGREASGDGRSPRLPDARELQLAVDPADGRVWFRFVLEQPAPGTFFGMNVALDVDGDPANGGAWWGQNKGFHYDRLLTAYLGQGAGYWQGMIGVSDAAQIAEFKVSGISSDVRVSVDGKHRTLAIGVPRAALGLPSGGKVRLVGTVGSNMAYNDDLPQEGALDVVVPDAAPGRSMSQ